MNHKLLAIGCLAFVWVSGLAGDAVAQINRPGAHPKPAVELEPHLVYQWSDSPGWNDNGIGVGVRASIPVVDSGPVTTINNSLAIGFGLDWAHFSGNCNYWNLGVYDNCSANDFWIPVVVQWNFFFSDVVSLFPELGLGFQHSSYNVGWCGPRNNPYVCTNGNAYTENDLELVFWLGARFQVAKSVALTVRLGTPSLLLGAAFQL